jgi:hypothetical protein
MGNSKQIGKPLSYSITDLWAGQMSEAVKAKLGVANKKVKDHKDEQLEARGSSQEE